MRLFTNAIHRRRSPPSSSIHSFHKQTESNSLVRQWWPIRQTPQRRIRRLPHAPLTRHIAALPIPLMHLPHLEQRRRHRIYRHQSVLVADSDEIRQVGEDTHRHYSPPPSPSPSTSPPPSPPHTHPPSSAAPPTSSRAPRSPPFAQSMRHAACQRSGKTASRCTGPMFLALVCARERR